MKPTRYYPFAPSKTFDNFVNDFFNRSIADFVGVDSMISAPSVNVIENGDYYRIEVAAPGLNKEDFEVSVDKNLLTISAQREQTKEEGEEGRYTRREFNYASFRRSFELPDIVESDHIEAGYENGILKIKLPKSAKAKVEEARYIEIK